MEIIGAKMGILENPFKLFRKLLVAGFKITGYTAIFIVQVVWYLFQRQTHHDIGLAFGEYGRSIINTIGNVFGD